GPPRQIALAVHGKGLPNVSLSVRCINAGGAVLVTLSLVNSIVPEQSRNEIEAASLFQTSLRVQPCKGTLLVPKPPRRGLSRHQDEANGSAAISDEESGALLYRNVAEFAVGHVCSAEWESSEQVAGALSTARWVGTTWLPSAIVEGVDPNGHVFFSELGNESGALDPLSAEALALADTASLQQALQLFCDAYDRWVQLQLKRLDDMADVSRELKYIAQMHLVRCEEALGRMRASILELLTNPRLRRAFQLANFAM
ncbi:TPA: DNA/RNA helicase, partial [Pseudomonas aeruginosa]|nr:DNA/RNA helicase [Pseudomonas aeruginosa]